MLSFCGWYVATTARGGIPLLLRRCQKVESILAINFEIEFDIVDGAGAYGVSFWELQATQLLPHLIDDADGDAFVELDRRSRGYGWYEREAIAHSFGKEVEVILVCVKQKATRLDVRLACRHAYEYAQAGFLGFSSCSFL